MYILEPIFHKAIWGGTYLVPIYGERAEGLAHLYSVMCRPDSSNIILNGDCIGRRLFNVMRFPLTVALVDAAQDLSIQVHPNDEAAILLDGAAKGKREAWYFIKKPNKGYIYCGIDNEFDFDGDILSHVGHLAISDGDYVFIRPGTVHAMTSGSFVYEIEEGSDLTYRIFDHRRTDSNNKGRELHIEKAKTATDRNAKPDVQRYSGGFIKEPAFSTCLKRDASWYKNTGKTYECLTFISDTGFSADGIDILKGMSIILGPGENIFFSGKQTDIMIAKVST